MYEVPNGWIEVYVCDLFSENFTGDWGALPNNGTGNAKVIRSTDIDDDGHVDYQTAADRVINNDVLLRKKLVKDDILLEVSGGGADKPVGRVAIFDGRLDCNYITSNFFRTLRPKAVYDSLFVLWRLLLLYKEPRIWRSQQQTTGIINLNVEKYLSNEIQIPKDTNEQFSISNILTLIDTCIFQTEAKIDKLGKIKAGLMQDLLTKGIDEDGEIRDPQKHPELFQDSPLGIIPKEWDVIQICENFTVQGGFAFSSNDFVEYGCPLLRISNIKDGRVDLVERASLPSNFRVTHRTFLAEENDIVMALSGATTGKSAIVKKQDLPLLVNQRVGRFINNDKEIYSSLFLFEIIQRQEFLKILLVDAIGGAQPNISPERIEKSLIPKPSYEEQLRITSVVLNVNKKINKEICYTIKLKLIKKGLMQDLLTGRKRVPKEMIKEGAIYA